MIFDELSFRNTERGGLLLRVIACWIASQENPKIAIGPAITPL